MKVILQEDIEKLGKKGEIVDVRSGYARNFLLPRELVVEATPQNIKESEKLRERKEQRQARELEEANKLAGKINNIEVTLKVKSGENDRLFGAVTSQEIAEYISQNHDLKIDKRKIDLKENIKALGNYKINVKVHPKVTAEIALEVIAE